MEVGESTRGVYASRHVAFVKSLEKVLTKIDSDGYVQQMFADSRSKEYVPDRILELIRTVLCDDREAMIEAVVRRLKLLEACLGEGIMRKLEVVGAKIESNEANAGRELKSVLEERLASVSHEIGQVTNKEVMEKRLADVKEEMDTLKIAVRSYEQQMRTVMMQVKRGAFSAMKRLHAFHKNRQKQIHGKFSVIVKEQNQSIVELVAQNTKLEEEMRKLPTLDIEKLGRNGSDVELARLRSDAAVTRKTMDVLGVASVEEMRGKVEEMLKDDLVERVRDDEAFLKSVFETLGAQVKFPLSSIVKRELLGLVIAVKSKSQATNPDVDEVLRYAAKAGYVGSSLSDAVLFMLNASRAKETEKAHDEMQKLISSASKDRALLEQRNISLNKKLEELRTTVSQLQAKSVSKEERTQVQLELERSRLRTAQMELENLRKIQQELLLVISGETKDISFLSSKLTTKEMELLREADIIRRLAKS